MWEFPKIRGTVLGVPKIRTIVFCGLYWGPPIWETTMYPRYMTHVSYVVKVGVTSSLTFQKKTEGPWHALLLLGYTKTEGWDVKGNLEITRISYNQYFLHT